ncbi:hypothetical protein [Sporosarcina sp. Marseille-Q4943]|uniref:hypothetical protein n=1 Tax=Sporosarcina sp. Marseille-Q4943 TaxID=2942204 RepID=UPI00208DD903|nr:hypothetical protein [Sporosarcina sp. Marseille-Q4943]
MLKNKKISIDPNAPDNLFTGAQKINEAFDEISLKNEGLNRKVDDIIAKLVEAEKLVSPYIPTVNKRVKTRQEVISEIRDEISKPSVFTLTTAESFPYFIAAVKPNLSGGNIEFEVKVKGVSNARVSIRRLLDQGMGTEQTIVPSVNPVGNIYSTSVAPTTVPGTNNSTFIGVKFDFLATVPPNSFIDIESIKITQDEAVLFNTPDLRVINLEIVSAVVPIGENKAMKYVMNANNTFLQQPKHVYVHPHGTGVNGLTSEDALSFDDFRFNYYPLYKDGIKYAVLAPGIYTVSKQQYFWTFTAGLDIVCLDGVAKLLGGTAYVQQRFIPVEGNIVKVSYDPTNHYLDGVRSGTAQPEVTCLSNGVDRRYFVKPRDTYALMAANPNSTYYDVATKELFIHWGDKRFNIAVTEVLTGMIMNGQYNSRVINVEVLYARSHGFRFAPTSHQGRKVELYGCRSISPYNSEAFSIDNADSVIVDCYAEMAGNDGFNFHQAGESILVNCESNFNYGDGTSHHYDCKGYMYNYRAKRNRVGGNTPAFGAMVYMDGVYTEGNGAEGSISYAGGVSVLGGNGRAKTVAYVRNHTSVGDQIAQSSTVTSLQGGEKAALHSDSVDVSRPTTVAYRVGEGNELSVSNPQGIQTVEGDVGFYNQS